MFTGLVEELGRVKSVIKASQSGRITVTCHKVLEGTSLGDSIAINGVCLTVVRLGVDELEADIMPETLSRSSLGALKPGDPVNLERALTLSTRLGGHLVQGHVDGVGVIQGIEPVGIARVFSIEAPAELMKYIVPKGSIAVDGVSLTVVAVQENRFTVSLIPHTGRVTALGNKKVGAWVNLETDILGRYVERLLKHGDPARQGGEREAPGLTLDFLRSHGF